MADQARAAATPDADARAADARAAILQLWQHRSAWPSGWPPPRAVEIVRLLEELPDLDDLPWHRISVLARLHDLHHHIIAGLIDVATGGDESIERGWLDTFGDRLTPEETGLLTRVAETDQRLSHLLRWWDRTKPEIEADDTEIDGGDHDTANAESAITHPLGALADAYRQTVLDLLDRASENGSDDANEATNRVHHA